MSEREENQPNDEPTQGSANAEPVPTLGNRPANTGQTVDTTSHTQHEWRGSEGASDFLGLSQDVAPGLAGMPGAVEETAPASGAVGESAGPSSSWLMSLDQQGAHAAEAAQTEYGAAEGEAVEEAPEEAGEEEFESAPAPSWRRPAMIAAAALVLVAGVALVVNDGRLPFGLGAKPDEVAPPAPIVAKHGPKTDKGSKTPALPPVVEPTPAPPQPTTETTEPPTVAVAPTNGEPTTDAGPDVAPGNPSDFGSRIASERLAEWMRAHPGEDVHNP